MFYLLLNVFTIRRNLRCQSAGQRLLGIKLVKLALVSEHLFVVCVHVGRILVLRNFFLYLVVDRLFSEHGSTRAVLVEPQGAVLRVIRPDPGLVDVTDLAKVDVRVLMVRVVKGRPLVRTLPRPLSGKRLAKSRPGCSIVKLLFVKRRVVVLKSDCSSPSDRAAPPPIRLDVLGFAAYWVVLPCATLF